MSTTVYRVEKNRNYTVMSNYHLRDMNLSLKARGLLSLMLSLPEDWDYSVKGLATICKEGVCAIRSAIKELEENGYLHRSRTQDEKGQLQDSEYIIRELPITAVNDDTTKADTSQEKTLQEKTAQAKTVQTKTAQAKSKSDKSKSTKSKKSKDKKKSEKAASPSSTEDKRMLEKLMLENQTLENHTQINKDKINKELLNTDCNYQSINHKDSITNFSVAVPVNDGLMDRYNHNIEIIKNNIGYDTLTLSYDKAVINEIVTVMAEVLTVDAPYYTIERKNYPTELVRQRFLAINYANLEAFLLEFSQRTDKIRNIKAYLITSLFNIPATAETNLTNMMQYNMYGKQLADKYSTYGERAAGWR